MIPATATSCCKNIISWIFAAAALFYFIMLPWMHHPTQRVAFIIFYSAFLLDFVINKRYKEITFSKTSILYVCFIVYFLLVAASALFEQDPRHAGSIIEGRLSFLGIGIVGLLGGLNDKIKVNHFAYAGTIMSLICIIHVLNLMGWSVFWENPTRFEIFNDFRHHNINAHMGFNFYLLLSVILTYCTAKKTGSYGKLDRAMTWFCSVSSIVLLWFVINSQGRIGMVLAILLILFIVADVLKHKPVFLGSAAFIIVLAAVMAIINEPRFSAESLTEQNPRLAIWELSWEKICEKPVSGYGSSSAYCVLKDEFLTEQWKSRINDGMIYDCLAQDGWWAAHSHNHLLQSWLELGIPGLLVSLAIMLLPFFCLRRDKLFLTFCLAFLFIDLQLMTDVIDGSYSAKHFCFYYLMMLSLQGDKRPLANTSGQ